MYNGESLAVGALSRGVVYITISSAAASVAKQIYFIFTVSIKFVDLHVNTYHETGAWFFFCWIPQNCMHAFVFWSSIACGVH